MWTPRGEGGEAVYRLRKIDQGCVVGCRVVLEERGVPLVADSGFAITGRVRHRDERRKRKRRRHRHRARDQQPGEVDPALSYVISPPEDDREREDDADRKSKRDMQKFGMSTAAWKHRKLGAGKRIRAVKTRRRHRHRSRNQVPGECNPYLSYEVRRVCLLDQDSAAAE